MKWRVAETPASPGLASFCPACNSPTPPNHRRGRTTAHPRTQLACQQHPQAEATAAESAPQCTLDADYQAQQPPTSNTTTAQGAPVCAPDADCPRLAAPNTTQPPPREHQRAPSTPNHPSHDRNPQWQPSPICHRRRSIAHPRTQLARQQHPQTEVTTTQSAIPCTLGANHPTYSDPKQGQPPPKEQRRAPSDAVSLPTAPTGRGNRHRGNNSVHSRRQLPGPAAPTGNTTAAQGAPACTLGADCFACNSPTQPNRRLGRNAAHPRRKTTPPKTATRRATATHLPPKAHHRAPSDAVSLPTAPTGRGNRSRGSTPVHPRR
ncbi:hypothetical protein CLV65_1156 [Pseudoscardovia suis]|uniref:Uncharacterized protein n=1 Tax=Pseudoscardovia suis TaxID=987063 RepID=A0A261EUJ7_9BIFI|nr:hypothetical protein PSSU_1219 [Pseudoscardovia suis]PJJ65909.1 hypothetical protein CLV65_1156 [Pseudoscardovia suis]